MDSNKRTVLDFLRQHQLMVLSTVNRFGYPESSILYFYVDDNFNAYCLTREATNKYANIMNNGKANILACDEENVQVVDFSGKASVVQDGDETKMVIDELHKIIATRKSEYWLPPLDRIDGHFHVLIKVTPTYIRYIDYGNINKGEKSSPKHIIINKQNQLI